MKTLLMILTALIVCIGFITKPTAEDIKSDDLEEVIIDSSEVYLFDLEVMTD
jgi:hypothetical protein